MLSSPIVETPVATPIVVLCAGPRCGSTLLVRSLGRHSSLESAEELFHRCWLQVDRVREIRELVYADVSVGSFSDNRPIHDGYTRLVRDEFNVLKIISSHIEPGCNAFRCAIESAYCILLYRKDQDAQVASWKNACRTGKWVWGDSGTINACSEPSDPVHDIARGFSDFLPYADTVVSYEELTENFDGTLAGIQNAAGLRIERLPQATKKQ